MAFGHCQSFCVFLKRLCFAYFCCVSTQMCILRALQNLWKHQIKKIKLSISQQKFVHFLEVVFFSSFWNHCSCTGWQQISWTNSISLLGFNKVTSCYLKLMYSLEKKWNESASHTDDLHMSLHHFQTSSLCRDLSSSLIFSGFSRFAIAWPPLQLTVWPTPDPLPRLLRLLTSLLPQSGQRCISIVTATWPFLPDDYFIMRPEVPPRFFSLFYLYKLLSKTLLQDRSWGEMVCERGSRQGKQVGFVYLNLLFV